MVDGNNSGFLPWQTSISKLRISFYVLKLWFIVLDLPHASHAHGATHMVDGDLDQLPRSQEEWWYIFAFWMRVSWASTLRKQYRSNPLAGLPNVYPFICAFVWVCVCFNFPIFQYPACWNHNYHIKTNNQEKHIRVIVLIIWMITFEMLAADLRQK